MNLRSRGAACAPEPFEVIKEHDTSQAGSTCNYLGVYRNAGGQPPQRARLVPCHVGRHACEVRELNDAGAASLLVADVSRSKRAHHAEIACFTQRFLVVCFDVPDARDAHKAGGAGAAAQTRVIRQHFADVDDNIRGAGW